MYTTTAIAIEGPRRTDWREVELTEEELWELLDTRTVMTDLDPTEAQLFADEAAKDRNEDVTGIIVRDGTLVNFVCGRAVIVGPWTEEWALADVTDATLAYVEEHLLPPTGPELFAWGHATDNDETDD